MGIKDITKPENLVCWKPSPLSNNTMCYCPGCSHGVVHKLVTKVLEETGMGDQAAGMAPVNYSVFAYGYIDVDWQEAAHRRAPVVATAIKCLYPNKLVSTYQGDGDLAVIGTAEAVHAANRGENIAIIFISNGIYGTTGGQMAPTTLLGVEAITCPDGRTLELNDYPLVISKILSELDGTCYVTHQSVHTAGVVRKAKKALREAFRNLPAGKDTSVIESVSTYNTGWKMTPAKANEWVSKFMVGKYVLGDIRDIESKDSSDEVVTIKI